MLTLFIASCLLELGLYFVRPVWFAHRYIAGFIILLTSFASGALVAQWPTAVMFLFAVISFFRIFNLFRIVESRMHTIYLRSTTLRTGIVLILLQLFLLSLQLSGVSLTLNETTLEVITYLQLLAASGLLGWTIRNIVKTSPGKIDVYLSDAELPTVSVLIPARNETADLDACLRSIIATDYPKIEIIVLDDCSHDKTANIIKQFAQDGVRFIKGNMPSDRWLAKNQAYDRLSQAATGDLLLFCGVDVRMDAHAIKSMVIVLQNRNKSMLSILPKRFMSEPLAALIQPMRYWWELSLPRRLFRKPPVLSTCWMINHEELKRLGGFAAVSRSIIPELFFAREFIKTDKYSFLRATSWLNIQTTKPPLEQQNTAIRVRYPQLRKRPDYVLGIVGLELILLLGPFIFFIASLLDSISAPMWPVYASALLLIATHLTIVAVTDSANVPTALISFPLAVIIEIIITLLSMCKYEFATVDWKGRNICLPVMQVIPRLPDIDKH